VHFEETNAKSRPLQHCTLPCPASYLVLKKYSTVNTHIILPVSKWLVDDISCWGFLSYSETGEIAKLDVNGSDANNANVRGTRYVQTTLRRRLVAG